MVVVALVYSSERRLPVHTTVVALVYSSERWLPVHTTVVALVYSSERWLPVHTTVVALVYSSKRWLPMARQFRQEPKIILAAMRKEAPSHDLRGLLIWTLRANTILPSIMSFYEHVLPTELSGSCVTADISVVKWMYIYGLNKTVNNS